MPTASPSGPADAGVPAWLRRTEGEQRWWVALAMLGAIALQTLVPDKFAVHPQYLLQVIELAVVLVVVPMQPDRLSERSTILRATTQVLFGLITVTNAIGAGLLVRAITSGQHLVALQLLLGGAEIWFTNVIVFGLWYWEYDRGGPASRALGLAGTADLLFPQMTDSALDHDWEPIFIDYLFVSYTNAVAFSPTDTMPLSRWAKVLFMLQSAISLILVLLIAARAVNILPGS